MGGCSDVMNPIEVSSCCTLHDTTADAARAIRDSGCDCAPVVENARSRAPEVRVEEIMRPSSACCEVDQSIEEAREQLHERMPDDASTAMIRRLGTLHDARGW